MKTRSSTTKISQRQAREYQPRATTLEGDLARRGFVYFGDLCENSALKNGNTAIMDAIRAMIVGDVCI